MDISKKDKANLLKMNKLILHFFNLIREELKFSEKLYGKKNGNMLKKYYSNIRRGEHYFKFAQHHYSEKVIHLIKNVSKGRKILDAGCGVGSESILCGILGGSVVGVDLKQ